jgi:hypothetical protein
MLPQAPFFQFRHGDHICVFYRTEDALMEVLTPYICEGLRKGERCFCVQSNEVVRRLDEDLHFLGIHVDREVKRGSLQFFSENEVYFATGKFDPHGMIRLLMHSVEESVEAGLTGFRSAGELSWAGSSQNLCKQVIGYEKLVKESYPGKPAIGMCLYRMSAFTPEVLNAVLETHSLQLVEPDQASKYASIQIGHGLYATEIVAERLVEKPSYYYVVQDKRPREVLGWGVATDFETATQRAKQLVSQVSS